MACLVHVGDEAKAVHLDYYDLVEEIVIVMVTLFKENRE